MSLFDFDTDRKPGRGKKTLRLVLGVGVLSGVLAIGSTFAADINLNSGDPIEFGQGLSTVSACDDQITVTPFSTFFNEADSGGSFKFTSLRISGIDSNEGKCDGKNFVIKAYGDSGLLDLFKWEEENYWGEEEGRSWRELSRYNSVEISNDGGEFTWVSGGTDHDDVIDVDNTDLSNTAFTINLVSIASTILRSPLASAESVKKITVETHDGELLANRVLTASQVGLWVPQFEIEQFCEILSCIGYLALDEWIAAGQFPGEYDVDDVIESFTMRFEYDPNATPSPWTLRFTYLGVGESDVFPPPFLTGQILGFNGNTGVFVPDEFFGGVILFSLDNAIKQTAVIGFYDPDFIDGDFDFAIRDFLSIWPLSEEPYVE